MPETVRITAFDLLARASRGLGKVDALGPRGCTLVSLDEIEAMAGLLAVAGLIPTAPGAGAPAHFFRDLPEEHKR